MYKINFCGNDSAAYGICEYKAIGSLDQIIDGARVKSMQQPELKYKQWLIRITLNGEFICSRTVKNGVII